MDETPFYSKSILIGLIYVGILFVLEEGWPNQTSGDNHLVHELNNVDSNWLRLRSFFWLWYRASCTVYASLSLVNYYYVKWWIYSHTDSTPLATNGQITDAEWKIYERFFRWFYISNPNFQNSNNIEILLSENARLKQLRKSTSNNNNYSNFIWVLRDRYLQSVQEIKQYEQAKSTEKFEVLTKSFNKKAQENVQKYQQNQEKYIRLINLQYKVSKKCLHNYQEQVSLIFNCKHM